MKLSHLESNERGIITKVSGKGAFRKRITEMGFVKGKIVKVIKNAPLQDPIQYNILGYEVSLRRSEASLIEVSSIGSKGTTASEDFAGTISIEHKLEQEGEKPDVINVALVGNPNSGKTTLFNHVSKSKERVGNYSGVTVESKVASFKMQGYNINIIDLPGTYSLSAYSPEELYVRNFLTERIPDIVVNVVDSSNIERNLYLTTQLIDMGVKVVIALNMFDELEKRGDDFDYEALGNMTGIPFIPTASHKGLGIDALFQKVIELYSESSHEAGSIRKHRQIHINYGAEIENSIARLQDVIDNISPIRDSVKVPSRYLAIKLLEKDKQVNRFIDHIDEEKSVETIKLDEISRLETTLNDDTETLVADARYGFISGALRETFKGNSGHMKTITSKIDDFLTHKIFGFPIFLFFMWVMFQATFSLGEYPMNWIEHVIEAAGMFLNVNMPEGMLKNLLIDGILSGVGGVIVFLPNILILFLFISIMEDTGYMARAAFLMDRIMHLIGLHGRSFIPLLMGFGCNVPAIMATRTINNRNNRILTILINPLMSCSARLPVYVLFISAFFPEKQGLILFLIYLTGILLAGLIAIIFKRVFFRSKEIPFVMELPPYRMPTFRTSVKHMWYKGVEYIKKMGGIILVASIIIWALGVYPLHVDFSRDYDKMMDVLEQEYNHKMTYIQSEQERKSLNTARNSTLEKIKKEKEEERLSKSYIGKLGQFIEPVIKPLGFEWKMGVSLISGIAAKEIVVSTLGVLYHSSVQSVQHISLQERLKKQVYTEGPKKGEPIFTPLVAISFLLFILIYFPCVAVIATIKRETGTWKWAVFTMIYTTSLAWLVSFSVYQIGSIILY